MKSIGQKLRSERERQGLSVSNVAGQLRISTRYLDAIEDGDISALPGGFFYRSFVRQYAGVLNLEDPGFESELNALTPSTPTNFAPDQPPGHFPIEVPPLVAMSRSGDSLRRTPVALIFLILVVLGCSGLYSLWYRNRNASREEAVQAQQSPPPAAPVVQQTQPPPVAVPAAEPEPAATTAAEQPAPAAQAVAPSDDKLQVTVTATEDAWISLSSAGKSLYVGVLKPGESKAIEASGTARLVVGNAGGIDLKINGKSAGPVGPRGQPRNLTITPGGITVVTPPDN